MTSELDSAQKDQLPSTKSIPNNTANGSKTSLFGVKSGFVIPRNKLSSSLMPLSRGRGKIEISEVKKEDNSKQSQRKTRWSSDPTQDASVRRGRSLAYQTRVEQITQQLKSGTLECGDDCGLESAENSLSEDKLNVIKKRESLELEKRELIGEILRLNPNYKAPPDYKPILKEAKIPISVKTPSGHNLIGIILGAESNTQKRLEEETGAKMRVFGVSKMSKEKREITRSDASDAQEMYEDLFIHLSAETYEKVDAAVSLVELLVTPVFPVPATVPPEDKTANSDSQGQSQGDSSGVQSTVVPVSLHQPITQPQIPAQQGPWAPHASSSGPAPGPYLPTLHRPVVTQSTPLPVPRGYPPPPTQTAPLLMPQPQPAQIFPQPGPIPTSSQHFVRPLTSVAPPPLRPATPAFTMFPTPQATATNLALPQPNSPFPARPSSFVPQSPLPIPSPQTSYPRVQVQAAPFPSTGSRPPVARGTPPTFFPIRSPGDFTFQPQRAVSPVPGPSPSASQTAFVPAFLAGPPQPPSYASPPSHAVALIQAHGRHVQSHSQVAPVARPLAPRPPPGKTDQEYEDLMASVGVK